MANAELGTVVRHLRRLAALRTAREMTDRQLLHDFMATGADTAFAALVKRHGPLVLAVCRRVLNHSQDAEDAFQATFLVLAQSAASIRKTEGLASWLHGVAHRIALKARRDAARRRAHEKEIKAVPPNSKPSEGLETSDLLSFAEVRVILDEEIQRLPERYRAVFVLCCLEGKNRAEVAKELGLKEGTVRSRLWQARQRLQQRLARRGVTLSTLLGVAALSEGASQAAVPAALTAATVRSALLFVGRYSPAVTALAPSPISAKVAALAKGATKAMLMTKVKVTTGLTLATCLLATGFLTFKAAYSPMPPPLSPRPLSKKAAFDAAAQVKEQSRVPRDEFNAPIEVSGRVLDPESKPVAGAMLYVGHSPRPAPFSPFRQTAAYHFRITSGADGRFHFTFAKSELDVKLLDASRPAVLAVAEGYGPDWAVIGDSGERVELTLKLVKDLPVNGRILDQDRRPVAGAKIRVDSVLSAAEEQVTQYLQGDANSWPSKAWMGSLPGQPAVLTTDADGRFRVTGIGRDRIVGLAVEGPGIQHTILSAVTRPAAATPYPWGINGAVFDYAASPSRAIRGVVREQTTGKPVEGVQISAPGTFSTAVTDRDGRYELVGCPKAQGYMVAAQPQTGQPYFAAESWVADGSGLDPLTLNFDLVSGIPVHGRVTDQSTQKPPRTAVVEYYPLFPNIHSAKIKSGFNMAASSAVTQPDGSYSLVTLPGPGIVCVAASPRDAYAVAVLDNRELASLFNDVKELTNPPCERNHGQNQVLCTAAGVGGQGVLPLNRFHALALVKPEESPESLVLDLPLQPGRTLRGTVIGPDGNPLTGVLVVGLIATREEEVLESASFTARGLNPRRSRDLFFQHKRMGLGKFLTLQGDETKPLTVQLEHCGTVIGRMVDRGGRPVAGVNVGILWCADYYAQQVSTGATDVQGLFRMESLVPGPKYSFRHNSSRRLLTEVGQVEVESDQSKDLGDLILDD